jgi:hypothetical protein
LASGRLVSGCLQSEHGRVFSAQSHQRGMITGTDDPATLEYEDFVALDD